MGEGSQVVNGMQTAISTLESTVSADALWGVFNTAVPYIAVITLFAFGFYIVRKLIKHIAKGKAGI